MDALDMWHADSLETIPGVLHEVLEGDGALYFDGLAPAQP